MFGSLRQNCSSMFAEMVRNKANLNERSNMTRTKKTLMLVADFFAQPSFGKRFSILVFDNQYGNNSRPCFSNSCNHIHIFTTTVLSDLITILHHKRRTTCSQFLSHELSSISKVVNHCHSSIHCRSPFGTTPLSLACHAKHIEEVEVIS